MLEYSIMGKSLAKLWRRWRGDFPLRVLMLGLDAAGKTTLLYQMKLGETVTTIPTIGFNVESVRYSKIDFTIWDVAGQDKARPLWRHYFQNTQVLIIVVASNDCERMGELGEEIRCLMNEDELRGVPVLIFANKQDLPNAMSPGEIEEKLNLTEILKDRKWFVQPSSATSGDGLYEGFTWITDVIKPEPAKEERKEGRKKERKKKKGKRAGGREGESK